MTAQTQQEMIQHLQRGSEFRRLGEWSQAVHHLTAAIKIYPHNFVGYVQRALAFNSAGNCTGEKACFEMAVNDLDMAISIGFDHRATLAEAFHNRACILSDDLGQHQRAIADFNKAEQLDAGHVGVVAGRQRAMARLG